MNLASFKADLADIPHTDDPAIVRRMSRDLTNSPILRQERMDEVRDVIAGADAEELERNCVPPASPGHPRKDHTVLRCLHVVLKEEWQHHRYAVRDLQVLEKQTR